MRLKLLILFFVGIVFVGRSQGQIPSPLSHFGFEIGENYHLTNYSQTEDYFKKIAEHSDRVSLQVLGQTEEDRNQYMVVVSSPENIRQLEHYRKISQDLALGKISDTLARKLADEGKAVVWIDGGLHATETVGTHQLIETIYHIVNGEDEEINKILEEVIILFVHANPDGHELVGNWYMKEKEPEKRIMGKLPVLYHKYIGHDNNRDFFMFNVAETRNMGKALFIDWIPQIVYNHHQSAPAGTVVVGPPYRDPFNYVYDPILVSSLDAVGAAMQMRLNVEDKPGYGQRGASRYSTWWNGGLRTSVYFHNMIGILTEMIGSPNPTKTPLYLNRMLPNGDSPNPIHPQEWNFRKSIDYSVSLNMAILNYAAANKSSLLYNIYKMGSNSIQKGLEPHLSIRPDQIDFIKEISGTKANGKINSKWYNEFSDNLERKDPMLYIIPSDQSDFSTAIKFLNRLILSGIEVEKVKRSFVFADKTYPKGSYIVRLAQAFRPHILDMFEPQDHPNDFEFEGGPPIPPYDAAGWTLAYTMGVEFDRIKSSLPEDVSNVLNRGELIKFDTEEIPKGSYLKLGNQVNDNYKIVNLLIKEGAQGYKDQEGDFYFKNTKNNQKLLHQYQSEIGFKLGEASHLPETAREFKKQRIAIWDNYGGSLKAGWMKWLLEDFAYDYEVVFIPDIDKGNLVDKYDLIIFAGGGVPLKLKESSAIKIKLDSRAEEYKHRIGEFSSDKTLPAIRDFVNQGGTLITIGTSTRLAKHLGVPQKNPLVKNEEGKEVPLSRQEFYIPGSVLKAAVNLSAEETNGLDEQAYIYFSNSPVFHFEKNTSDFDIVPLLSFDSNDKLKSGWALGEEHLTNAIAAYKADFGKGKIMTFGPEITFRGQTHNTFKLLFNQFY